jgi:RNA polymerase sporulation-specific sigma factor
VEIHRRSALSADIATKDEKWRRELKMAQQGDTLMRDSFVTKNMGLVYMVVRRFENRGVDREELIQIGAIGLIKAVDRFDVTLPYTFSTYAVPRIIGEIRRFLRDDGMIHISRSVKENAGKIAIIRERKKKIENREPTLEELRQLTGLSKEDLLLAIDAAQEVDSISKPIWQDDGAGRSGEERLIAPERFEGELLNRLAVQQVLEKLSEKEQQLISLRYMQGCTQTETAGLLGTNQVAISRLERKVLAKLRRMLE